MDETRFFDKGPGIKQVPLLPLRDIIIFPHMVVPLFVGREKSISALEEAMNTEKDILLVAQINAKTNDPKPDDIFKVGTLGTIIQMLRLPDGTVKVLVEGKKRARILRYTGMETYFTVEVEEILEDRNINIEVEALMRSLKATFETYVKLNKRIPPEMLASVAVIDDPARLADTIVAHLHLKLLDKQKILEIDSPKERLEKLYGLMQAEIEILQVEKKIRTRVKKQMEKTQKEYYLNEQMQAIQKELGERDEFKTEIQELEEKLKKKKLTTEGMEKCRKEIKKLKMMSPMSAEATVVRNYIDWILVLPWDERKEEKHEIKDAEKILEEDHYGLDKAKGRIIEYLAVNKLVGKMKGPILCLVGPPGVGKTSLARSIARATGRDFVRLSLGGVRDEAEIRGHRRTYIGAMPGKIIQSLKKAGSSNPVFLLDEVDKMSMDFRGDPSAALLEVLDPEQNNVFNDHYLDLDYDLSNIMFITTANTLQSIPSPLQDRMEIIRIPGYTEDEKLTIAQKYLIKKQREANGLKEEDIQFADSGLKMIVRRYTKEAGVRNLEREIATVCRKVAKEIAENPTETRLKKVATAKNIPNFLGIPKFRYGVMEEKDEVGITTGLAWTEVGGELLSTEVTVLPGKGKLTITGKLGDVMQESAQAAMSYVRSRALQFGLDRDFYQKVDIHIHVPEGAIPKDGPSAGITMATTITSALLRIPVRKDIAMTGEITLRGKVLPIGGLKEKLLAAHRGQIRTIIIPKENEKDLKDVPKKILSTLHIICADHMDEVLKAALKVDSQDRIFKNKDFNIVMEEIYSKKPPVVETKPQTEIVAH
ncbi:MAG TPA: endopeptidase La [Deltaproteobacteria bacterium]|nr:endopeptidase La [Deltaproteobacteria bacterium]